MGKTRKKEDKNQKEIKFDVKKRFDYVTGFRKRKEQRRLKAYREQIEAERQDRIDVKREYREDIKRQYKEVAWAERRVEKLIDGSAFTDIKMLTEEEIEGLTEAEKRSRRETLALPPIRGIGAGMAARRPVTGDRMTLKFAPEEDDDPFGDCEVITTIGGVSNSSDGTLALIPGSEPFEGDGTLAKRERGKRGSKGGYADESEWWEENAVKSKALKLEEKKLRKGLDKKVMVRIEEKKNKYAMKRCVAMKKKKNDKSKQQKKGARARRNAAKGKNGVAKKGKKK